MALAVTDHTFGIMICGVAVRFGKYFAYQLRNKLKRLLKKKKRRESDPTWFSLQLIPFVFIYGHGFHWEHTFYLKFGTCFSSLPKGKCSQKKTISQIHNSTLNSFQLALKKRKRYQIVYMFHESVWKKCCWSVRINIIAYKTFMNSLNCLKFEEKKIEIEEKKRCNWFHNIIRTTFSNLQSKR